MIDLFQPGAYARTAGGNLERPDIQAPVVKWMAWSLNSDNGGGGGTAVWDRCRGLWAGAGIQDFPWMHVRSMADLQRLLSVGEAKNSPALGVNIEDVVDDGLKLQEVGGFLLDFWVNRYEKPVHMATLDWVQNAQGWQYMSFAVAALEFFPGEGSMKSGWNPTVAQQCIDHAQKEGLEKIAPILRTAGQTPSVYGSFFSICHSLYTADDITPTAPAWNAWKANTPCTKITPPIPPPVVPLTEKQFPYTGPFYEGDRNHPTIKGLKRGQVRLGNLKQNLSDLTDDFGLELKDALKAFQRDVGISPATGAYGRGTWMVLRSAKVPAEFPNAGQYAMDALALKLVREDALTRCYPHPEGSLSQICQGLHPTAGLSGNWAIDFCAPGGTKVLAVERATIRKLSGRDPASGADQTIGIFGWSIHYETSTGYRYFSTHYGARSPLTIGQVVEVGQVLGTVGSWPGDPSRSHTHLGVTSPLGTADAKKRITEIAGATKVPA